MIGLAIVTIEQSLLGISRVVISWTADASGVVDADVELPMAAINRLVTVPSAAAPPAANYDLVVERSSGIDMLAGRGADRSAAAIETVGIRDVLTGDVRYVQPWATERVRFRVANAGDSGSGLAVLYMEAER